MWKPLPEGKEVKVISKDFVVRRHLSLSERMETWPSSHFNILAAVGLTIAVFCPNSRFLLP
jgi:hypothetical protein